jgi:uncharacterized RDD family membrane protein YckC
MNCPTCGLLNLPAAKFCIHCKSSIDSTPQASSPAGGNVIELNRAKVPAASSGGAQAQRAPAQQSDWREQLSLKLERLKDKSADAAPRSDALDEDFRQREFVRPGTAGSQIEPEASVHRGYHPLAEKALEKIDRAKASSTESTLEIPPDLSTTVPGPPEPEISSRRRRSARRSEKTERIEIDLSQPTLPFESGENPAFTSQEERVQKGLSAAALAPRVRAGLIDALFIFGCFLIFLLIVFFVPEFSLFTRSSLLGLGFVLLIIFLSYIATFTALGAKTLGMDHEQLEVVNYHGDSIAAKEARLRSFGYLVSLGCFGLGFLWALFDPEQLTWHDKISRTLVVRKPANSGPPS